MPIITLLTDFGVEDEYVGIMKGVILTINPAATIVDISHHIDPQDLLRAAYMIQASYKYFPPGTVHVAVVDPGVGSDRDIIAVKTKEHILLAPDNGVLTFLNNDKRIEAIVRVENPDYFLDTVSQTFHGRDIFAPVAAHLSAGLDISKLGPPLDQRNLVTLCIHEPYVSENDELIGTIASIDRFGNLITNIDEKTLKKFRKTASGTRLEIQMGEYKMIGLSQSYESVEPQSALAIMGSRGYLEIAVSCGNAEQHFIAEKGDIVRIRLTERSGH